MYAFGRTAVEQAVLGGLPLLNPAWHWLFQASAACGKPAPKLKCTLAAWVHLVWERTLPQVLMAQRMPTRSVRLGGAIWRK
jgi:hypothetical protein